MNEYYKSKAFDFNCIVRKTKGVNGSSFMGVVVKADGIYKKGAKAFCHLSYCTPYTPTPQELIEWGETATITNDNPNKVQVDDKDVELRLECLKLAVIGKGNVLTDMVIADAQHFYDWITTNQ
jgi:hypothetical protein